ncbi:MAG: OmcA/MtrC family decaheme c-type cytochrome [Acidobacteria bacterium]|nr:OmcA/MtrC family decaheme c-type cytochrome [Acidobacteriota bacterium]
MKRIQWPKAKWTVAALLLGAAMTLVSQTSSPYRPTEAAAYLDPNVVNFVRPGLVIKVESAEVATDGTISAVVNIADPRGLALDRLGVNTPGPVSLSFVAAYLPRGQAQYVSYTTRQATGAVSGTVTQAASDAGGAFTQLADGKYRYRFNTKAPATADRNVTHTIGVYGNRNLTEFGLPTNFASNTFNFVPTGAPVLAVRDVIRTESCNRCHDQLSFHGGSRRGIEMCVLCHTPQTSDPDTGNTMDLPVLVHKLHMGKDLPSVKAGTPYRVIGNGGAVSDWSTVGFPARVQRCEVCHEQDTPATQKATYLANPTRASCGSCHDDINFATGKGHVAGPQPTDNLCATCHIPQGEIDFDASIKGAHVVPTESAMLSGINFAITRVTNNAAGQKPVVTFTVKDNKGQAIPLNRLGSVSLVLAGPTKDYGYTKFGADVSTPGYVSESAIAAPCSTDGTCIYTFNHAIPEGAKGSFAVGIEGRRTEVLLAGTTSERSVQYGGKNKVFYFSVDNSPVEPRRTVVKTENCNACHQSLSLHGENRNQVEMCVLCHNPSQTDSSRRPTATVLAERSKPNQSVNFNLMVHKIHTGEELKADGRGYTVIGFGGSVNDFTEVRYPPFSPNGRPGDRRNCSVCHVSGSHEDLTRMVNDVVDPQGLINPVKPITAACTGCHLTTAAASHALNNTSSLGESCLTCHKASAEFSVAKEHAQY